MHATSGLKFLTSLEIFFFFNIKSKSNVGLKRDTKHLTSFKIRPTNHLHFTKGALISDITS